MKMIIDTTLPATWKASTLGSVAQGFLSGGTPSTKNEAFWQGTIPWITSKWLNSRLYLDSGEKIISDDAVRQGATTVVPRNNMIFATRVGVGKVAVNRIDLAINQDLAGILVDSDRYDIPFLAYQLRSDRIQRTVTSHKRGATIQGITRDNLKGLELCLPPLPEQRKIAGVLGLVQRTIEQQERLLQLTAELKKTLLHQLFTQGLHGEPQKQTEIGPVPESWEVDKIGDHCASSAFGPRFSSDLYTPGGNVVTLRTTDLDDEGNIDYREAPKAQLGLDKFESHLLKIGDVVVSRSGTCGIAAVFDGHEMPVLPGAFLIRIRLAPGLRPQFLRYYINSPVGRPRIMNLAQGAIQKNISGTALKNFDVPVPSIDEQKEIEKHVDAVDRKLRVHTQKKQALADLFRTLLHQLMTAQIRVYDLDLPELGAVQ